MSDLTSKPSEETDKYVTCVTIESKDNDGFDCRHCTEHGVGIEHWESLCWVGEVQKKVATQVIEENYLDQLRTPFDWQPPEDKDVLTWEAYWNDIRLSVDEYYQTIQVYWIREVTDATTSCFKPSNRHFLSELKTRAEEMAVGLFLRFKQEERQNTAITQPS